MHASSSPSDARLHPGGWIYVLELVPTGYVKVGRTAKLGARLTAHIANAGFGGGAVARTFSIACADDEAVERALLDALRCRPGAVSVHGKETFSGVSFPAATAVASELVAARRLPAVELGAAAAPQSVLAAVAAAAEGAVGMHTADLLARLVASEPGVYSGWDARRLAAALRPLGVQPEQLWLDGQNRKGYRLALIRNALRRWECLATG